MSKTYSLGGLLNTSNVGYRFMRVLTGVLLVFVCIFAKAESNKPIVVLLSIDGFSFEYLSKNKPSNLLKFAKSGVYGELKPVYPSKTFPNHLSIITGTYPVKHGITNNRFYNHQINQSYYKGAGKTNKRWVSAQPFWFFAQQQGLKSAVYFWPESEALGKEPTYNIPFNRIDSNSARFSKILQWLKLPKKQRPHFIASYFSIVDSAGHSYGPNSNQVSLAITEIDNLIGEFVQQVKKEIDAEVNFIIVSDHGMVLKDREQVIRPSSLFNKAQLALIENKTIIVSENDTQLFIYFNKLLTTQIERNNLIKKISNNNIDNDLYDLYTKGNYPQHWQLNYDMPTVPDMIFEATSPATFVKENHKISDSNYGTHGYDAVNKNELMGTFIAFGPRIVNGKKITAFENIHVFSFMSNLLNLQDSKVIDGNADFLIPYIVQ